MTVSWGEETAMTVPFPETAVLHHLVDIRNVDASFVIVWSFVEILR